MLVMVSLALSARAHEGLEEPIPRYESDGFSANKACPCGVGPNDGMCSQSERSDPNRSADRINTYASGETITVRLHEVIGHTGRWRIAFDPDGADMDDFNANILLDEPDPPGSVGNVDQSDLWEFVVTLPDVACDSCTLQVLQVMNGNTTDPVPDPVGQSTYYQCADLALIGGPIDTSVDTETTDTDTPPQTDTTPQTGVSDTTPPGDSGATGEDKGCGCGSRPAPSALWAGALGLVGVLRRQRRSRPAR